MNDLISRQSVVDIIHKEMERTTSFSEHETQINIEFAVKELPRVDVTDTNVGGKWIPVAQKLPEKTGFVLTTVRGEEVNYYKILLFVADRNHFVANHREWSEAVLAWMPIPEPFQDIKTDNA